MTKIDALKTTSKLISDNINTMKRRLDVSYNSLFNSEIDFDIIYESHNSETSYTICKIKSGQKTDKLIEDTFKRIVCLKGTIIVYIPIFDDETVMYSPNSILIPPNIEYSVEVIEDAEIMDVYKPKKVIEQENLIKESIYNKIRENE